ncbi:GNAT family N-acetyltransferase [Dictyobacter formicarum]|nr:GNAT family N-acetyltransferase [Dictyobacter formicarum]
MTFTDRELLRLHVEAVWGVTLPAVDNTSIELSATGLQPDWLLYVGKLAAETIFIWRPDVTPGQRQQIAHWHPTNQPGAAGYAATYERAFVLSHAPATSLATARTIARPLTEADYPLLETYEKGYGEYFFQPQRAPLFGVIKDQRLLSIAHSSRRTNQACELGIETHPQARRQGFGLAATILWANSVYQEGLLPLYSALAENDASIQLAQAAGYRPFVLGATIRLA